MMSESSEPSETSGRTAPKSAGVAMRAALERVLGESGSPSPGCPAIPDHVLLQRIGAGAYGDVWLARSALGYLRAVKVVYRERFDEERPFQREFHGILKYEPISRSHEGLVAILHVGRNDEAGYFYYVMELADPVVPPQGLTDVNGQKLRDLSGPSGQSPYVPRTLRAELAGRRRFGPTDAANLAIQLAGALEHLHVQGLVHRDIKPSNVIFVGGQPKLADIGLVTAAGDSRSFVGTEGFIPPEGPGTRAADLYGLGKLLYELATGRDRMDFPQLPPGLNQQAEGPLLLELNEVITRACAPDPQHRYTTAAELAADLRLFLAGHSLREARQRERHFIFLRRFAVAACLSVILAGLAVWIAHREAQQAKLREQELRRRADTESALRRRAEAAEHQAQQQLYSALIQQARTSVRSGEQGHRTKALDALRQAAGISNTVELRREALRALALPDLRFERKLPIPPEVTFWELDPRFERLALCKGSGPVQIRSTAEDRLLSSLPASANLSATYCHWSPDGRFLVVMRNQFAGEDHADIEVWNVSGARCLLVLRSAPTFAFSFDPHRPRFSAATGGQIVETWDLERTTSVARVKVDYTPRFLAVAPDGERFACCFEHPSGWTLSVNLLTNGQPLASHHFAEQIGWCDWQPSGSWIATADFSGAVNLVNPQTGETRLLGRHKVQAVLTTFSPDGAYLLSGGWERELLCWDMQTLDLAFAIDRRSFSAAFRTDGRQCALKLEDGVEFYTFETPAYARQLGEDLGGRIWRAAFSPDDRWFAAPGDARLGLWDLKSKGPPALVPEGADARPYFSPDGTDLFAGGYRHCYHWRMGPGTNAAAPPFLERVPLDPPKGFTSLAVVSNLLAFTTTNGSQIVDRYQPPSDDQGWKDTIEGNNGTSPDGRWLAVYPSFSRILSVYEAPQLRLVASLTNGFSIKSFAFSPAGDELAVASNKRIEFWSTGSWQRTREITNFMAALYTPDGTALWLTRDYRSGGLYNLQGTQPLLPLPNGLLPLALSHDGRFLALSLEARRIQIWDMDTIHSEFRKLGIDWETPPTAASSTP